MATQHLKPAPPAFPETFIRHGWRGIETAFGARNIVHRRWIEDCGGEDLFSARLAYRRNVARLRAQEKEA